MIHQIQFKDYFVLKNFLLDRHPILSDVFLWVHEELNKIETETIVTCAYEKRDKSSVHSVIPYRGLDLRSSHLKNPNQEVNYINNIWQYDHTRPHMKVAIYHNVGRGAHIHLQVSDNTSKRLRRSSFKHHIKTAQTEGLWR